MSERDEAIALAIRVLDRPSGDPDDDLAVLARQFLREIEAREMLQREKEEGRGALAWAAHCWITEKGLSGELRKMCPADISYGLSEVIGKAEPPSGRGDLLMEIARLRASEGSRSDERAWLPIESAPRDGTLVLGWVTAIRGRHTLIRFVGGSDWPWATATGYDRGPYKEMQVSHWMPLPEPPEEKIDV